MADKYATIEDFALLSTLLIEIRAESLAAFLPVIIIAKENTADEGYKAIMKEFNKHLK